MDLAQKLQLKGRSIAVLNAPKGFTLDAPTVKAPKPGDAVLLFAATKAELHRLKRPVVEAALRDDLAWVAYPKAGKLGTDLHRDILVAELEPDGIQGVRLVAVDDTWSAARFRPAE
jgi:hypothetical protein